MSAPADRSHSEGGARSSLLPPLLVSTYRLQLNKDFTLHQAREIVPYLHALGVSHVYASPVLTARPGSMHGYDVADPARVNPELGGEEALRALAGALHERGMGLLVDIVPNHMGIGPSNPYWMDVLRHGRGSRWAHWFDIDWDAHRGRPGKLALPVLGDEPEAVLARGELTLEISEHEGAHFKYFDSVFPIDPGTLPPALQLVQFDPNAREAAEAFAQGEAGRARLAALLAAQHYHLAFWRLAPQEINYRRFFDVNELAALRMEDPRVFEETHALILQLVRDGVIDGLRIDHIDGVRDPLGYLAALRAAVGRRASGVGRDGAGGSAVAPDAARPTPDLFPIVVEKILSPGEQLRGEWPVEGTTGYEFLNDLEGLYIHHEGALAIERGYRQMRRLVGRDREIAFEDVAREGKLKILRGALFADMKRLARRLDPMMRGGGPEDRRPGGGAATEGGERRASHAQLTSGIIQLLASMPVYRTYIDGRQPLPYPEDREVLERAVARAEEHSTAEEHAVVAGIARTLLAPLERDAADREERLDFILTLQQTSGPATAKGVEDTALYNYFPLLSRNEVGGEPDRRLHDAAARLHEANASRSEQWPLALLTTNTHDTKRSADLRARLDVLSECPETWLRQVARWRRLNRRHRVVVKGRLVPDTNTEYLIYQTLVGLWPSPAAGRRVDDPPPAEWLEGAVERMEEYMMKAVKEAKAHTSWTDPNAEYEEGVKGFIRAVMAHQGDTTFLSDVSRFVATIARAGQWTALSRVLVHYTAPGTPDTYRGDEWWTFNLVDPDNRRPVDFAARQRMLEELEARFPGALSAEERGERLRELARVPEDDRLKLYIAWRILQARRRSAALFTAGEYLALSAHGTRAAHVFAFAKVHEGRSAVVVAPRLLQGLAGKEHRGGALEGEAVWGDTEVELPRGITAARWRCAFTGREVVASGGRLPLSRTLAAIPMALLISEE